MKISIGIKRFIPAAVICLLAACSGTADENTFIGYVEGDYIYVNSPQSGWIDHFALTEGDSVQAGDLLFELDKDLEQLMYQEAQGRLAQSRAQAKNLATGARPEEIAALNARLAEANAQLVFAQSEYDRKFLLVEQEILSEADGDALVANLNRSKAAVQAAVEAVSVAELAGRDALREAAEAGRISSSAVLSQTEWRLNQRSVSSRVSGRVEVVFRRQGEFVAGGAPVLSILPPGNIKIRFFIPQERVPDVKVGSIVRIRPDGMDQEIDAIVSFVAREAEFTPPVIYSTDARQKLVFMVEARPDSTIALRPGLPVDVRLDEGNMVDVSVDVNVQ